MLLFLIDLINIENSEFRSVSFIRFLLFFVAELHQLVNIGIKETKITKC